MAEDLGERTEQPTDRRISEARDKGQTARSADLSAAVILTAVVLAAITFAGHAFEGLSHMLRHALSGATLGEGFTPAALLPDLTLSFAQAARVAAAGALTESTWKCSR